MRAQLMRGVPFANIGEPCALETREAFEAATKLLRLGGSRFRGAMSTGLTTRAAPLRLVTPALSEELLAAFS